MDCVARLQRGDHVLRERGHLNSYHQQRAKVYRHQGYSDALERSLREPCREDTAGISSRVADAFMQVHSGGWFTCPHIGGGMCLGIVGIVPVVWMYVASCVLARERCPHFVHMLEGRRSELLEVHLECL